MGGISLPVHSDDGTVPRQRSSSAWKIALSTVGLLALGSLVVSPPPLNLLAHGDVSRTDVAHLCKQPSPPGKPSNWSSIFDYDAFKMDSAKRLSGAVQIPTQSFDDMGTSEIEGDDRWRPFVAFREYLWKTFPATKHAAKFELISQHSILLTIEGSDSELKPLMLTAHQDVVPAITSLDRWTYPPFDGVIDGEWIYGRGSSDDKNMLIALMTSMEHLLINGFKPTRTIILAFGQDEEIGGPRGAAGIGKHLEERYGKNGIAMIVDEGGSGLDERYGVEFAKPAMAEKGNMDFTIKVDTLGGHSSIPHKHSAIGVLGKIAGQIEEFELFKPFLKEESPIYGYLQCLAAHGDATTPSWIKKAVSSKKSKAAMAEVAEKFAEGSDADRYLVQTSKAVTIFNGGVKVNALSEQAIAHVNSRIELYATEQEIIDAWHSVIDPIAKDFGFVVNGKKLSDKPSIGNITTSSAYTAPSKITSQHSPSFAVFAAAVQAAFGPEVVTTPSSMTGNTDTRLYLPLTDSVYRWAPVRQGYRQDAHTVDERLRIDAHVEAIKFFAELIVIADQDRTL